MSAIFNLKTIFMSTKKKPTETQEKLLEKLRGVITDKVSKTYGEIKAYADARSFDTSFNALLHKGYVKRDPSRNDNSFLINS